MATDAVPPGHVVRLVLVPHVLREPLRGKLRRLTSGERRQAERIGWCLETASLKPDAILFSCSGHAPEHAKVMSGIFRKRVPVIPVSAPTPDAPEVEFEFAAFRRADTRIDWRGTKSVAWISDEDRLNRLAHATTGEKPQPLLAYSEALCIEGTTWDALEQGHGRIVGRTQPTAVSPDDTDLLPKIHSKVQTSALLAGFTSAVFGVLLTDHSYWTVWSGKTFWPSGPEAWEAAAMAAGLFCLAFATLLFVVSIYMYDRLGMPQRLWEIPSDEPAILQERWRSFRRDRVRCSLLYAHMIWVWRFVFSVAVGMAMLGFLALVLHRRVWLVAILYLVATGGAVMYYRLFRPELGVD